MTVKKLSYIAYQLLEDGHTEDIELLKAITSLEEYIGWPESNVWAAKIKEGTAGRNEIREALKLAKEKAKQEKAADTSKPVSHAKPKEPPPPTPWMLEDALDDISQALTYPSTKLSAIDLYRSWTEEHQEEFQHNLHAACCFGKTQEGFKTISNMIMNGTYGTPFIDVELAAMVWGFGGNDIDLLPFFEQLQIPREKP